MRLVVAGIGSIDVLIRAKQKGLIPDLRSHFEKWISEGRYFSLRLLNNILTGEGERLISKGSSDL